jgi:alpha-N-arabinofuranosidase
MKKRRRVFRHSIALILVASAAVYCAGAKTIFKPALLTVTVDASKTGEPITKYIYGQFIEHKPDQINKGLWAEMLDDRKFFYPVTSRDDQQNTPQQQRKRWRPIGPDESVVMDRERPYVGDHTPLIKLEGGTPRGIQQAGLALRRAKAYTGRIVLAGEPGVAIAVSLIWGPNHDDRQIIPIKSLRREYAKFPLQFTAGADTQNGRLEITGTGESSFHVGAVSLMPADNIHGFRPDTTSLLKQLNSGIYRFPGGNFVSNHDWYDAIGDPDKRPPTWDNAWNAVQPNDVGIDEFMILCSLLGVEPYISVNAGFGDAHSAAELVEYANGSLETPMGKLRAANGHPAPYNIKWWGIGNEMYGAWQFGTMALRQYVIKHNMFGKAMRRVDPTIKLLAAGASPDEMAVTRSSLRITGKVLAEYGSDADWTGGLFANCLDYIDVMTEHLYPVNGERFDILQGKRVAVQEPLVEWSRRPANRVRCKVEHYEEYRKRIPALREKRVPINIDEWSYSGARPNLKLALSYAWMLHEMFRHTNIITMANHTFALRCINGTATDAAFNTTGLLFKLYRGHFGTIPVEVTGNSPQPAPKYPVGADQPRVNAGSPTYPLDVAAALSADRRSLTVAIINLTEAARDFTIAIKGFELSGKGRLWRMTGSDANAANELGKKPQVEVVEIPFSELPKTVPPISISLYEVERR